MRDRSLSTPVRPMRGRGLSTVVNYALMLVVVGLLVSGILIGMNGQVGTQTDRVVRSELSVAGNQLAGQLTTADQLAGTVGPNGTIEMQTDLVDSVSGETYLITIDRVSTNRTELTLAATTPEVSVTVTVRTDHPIEEGRYHGGDLTVVSNGTALEVRDG